MADTLADELKKRGNEAFTAKRYEDAVVLYDKAIEMDPNQYVYYNNRAAANHELKHYDKAIEDAKKALVLQDNAKSHYRIGAALWAQGKLPEARISFEMALGIEPSNKNAQASIDLIDRSMSNLMRSRGAAAARAGAPPGAMMTADGVVLPPLQGGEFTIVPSGLLGVFVDAAVLLAVVGHVVCTFLLPAQALNMWNVLMSMTMAQQLVVMKMKNLLQPNMETLGKWFKTFSALLFVLCVFALVIGNGPQLLVSGFIAMYSALGLASRREELRPIAGPLGPIVMPYLDRLAGNMDSYKMMAASFEAMATFAIPLTGGAWFTLIYIQYAINRFKSDRYVQASFASMRKNTLAAGSRFLPAAMSRYLEKFCDLLYACSQQNI